MSPIHLQSRPRTPLSTILLHHCLPVLPQKPQDGVTHVGDFMACETVREGPSLLIHDLIDIRIGNVSTGLI